MSKILVVGDVIIDEYLDAHAVKICPDAACLSAQIEWGNGRSYVGAAGNVALNLKALGHDVSIVYGKGFGWNLEEFESVERLPLPFNGYPTIKIRVLSDGNIIFRIDREWKQEFNLAKIDEMRTVIDKLEPDAIVISDYGKGLVQALIGGGFMGFLGDPPLFIDAHRGNVWLYKRLANVALTCFSARDVPDDGVDGFLPRLEKHGKRGFYLVTEKLTEVFAPYDEYGGPRSVVGAGDALISAIVHTKLKGKTLRECCSWANRIVSKSVTRLGNVRIMKEDSLDI